MADRIIFMRSLLRQNLESLGSPHRWGQAGRAGLPGRHVQHPLADAILLCRGEAQALDVAAGSAQGAKPKGEGPLKSYSSGALWGSRAGSVTCLPALHVPTHAKLPALVPALQLAAYHRPDRHVLLHGPHPRAGEQLPVSFCCSMHDFVAGSCMPWVAPGRPHATQ